MRKFAFALWSISFLFLIGLYYFLFESGFLSLIRHKDETGLCMIMLAILPFIHTLLGNFIYKYSKNRTEDFAYANDYPTDKEIDIGYEVAEYMMMLGMAGTVIGFIIMATSISGVDFTNVSNIGQMFAIATHGMSTSFYTTVVGLATSLWIRASFFVFNLLR